MQEEFVNMAMEAFKEANGDTDKFELYIRRKVMAMKQVTVQQTQPIANNSVQSQVTNTVQSNIPAFITPGQVDSFIQSLDPQNPLLNELASMDVGKMSDSDVLAMAQRMGFLNTPVDQIANMMSAQQSNFLSNMEEEKQENE